MLISESTWERKAHPIQRNQNLTVEMFFKEIGISMSHIVSLTSKKQEVSFKKWMWIHSCISCHKLVLLSSAPEKKNSVPLNIHKKGLRFFAFSILLLLQQSHKWCFLSLHRNKWGLQGISRQTPWIYYKYLLTQLWWKVPARLSPEGEYVTA